MLLGGLQRCCHLFMLHKHRSIREEARPRRPDCKTPGQLVRSWSENGAWRKMRVNAGQEFVIGGYTLGNPFDALVFVITRAND